MTQKKLFQLSSSFSPTGDQPRAIEALCKGVKANKPYQTLLGATGTGKTFTMANIIQEIQKPTLILAHNKTLAAQLCSEFQQFFPNNAIGYFVSYYDYYQPEAYMAKSDTYIAKEATINDEIAKFRHAATVNLLTRSDTLVISSVSCIYGLGDVDTYKELVIKIETGKQYPRKEFLRQLVDIQYKRIKHDFRRGTFEVLGDVVTIFPPNSNTAFQLEFWGDDLESITEVDDFTGESYGKQDELLIFPASHTATTKDRIEESLIKIEEDMKIREKEFKETNNHLAAQRIVERTKYDIEMMKEMGYVNGIENYTRYLNQSPAGAPPSTLLDYFPKDFLCFVDESHISIPQIGGMYNGNLSRKESLVTHGFRLPSAVDNRPLRFEEYEARVPQTIFVSATPGKYEKLKAPQDIVEQIIRPTGLVDPHIEVHPTKNQIDHILEEIKKTIAREARVLITTTTKKSAEDFSEYLIEAGIKAKYLHSEIDTIERVQILTELRQGKIDVLVGINLLREGLDLPEVEFIGIMDADKEGFLRSRDALLQVIGRAARNENGHVFMYADRKTEAIRQAIDETNRRRVIQEAYNKKHNITPKTIKKAIIDISQDLAGGKKRDFKKITKKDQAEKLIKDLEQEMDLATKNLDFERAAIIRDEILELEKKAMK